MHTNNGQIRSVLVNRIRTSIRPASNINASVSRRESANPAMQETFGVFGGSALQGTIRRRGTTGPEPKAWGPERQDTDFGGSEPIWPASAAPARAPACFAEFRPGIADVRQNPRPDGPGQGLRRATLPTCGRPHATLDRPCVTPGADPQKHRKETHRLGHQTWAFPKTPATNPASQPRFGDTTGPGDVPRPLPQARASTRCARRRHAARRLPPYRGAAQEKTRSGSPPSARPAHVAHRARGARSPRRSGRRRMCTG